MSVGGFLIEMTWNVVCAIFFSLEHDTLKMQDFNAFPKWKSCWRCHFDLLGEILSWRGQNRTSRNWSKNRKPAKNSLEVNKKMILKGRWLPNLKLKIVLHFWVAVAQEVEQVNYESEGWGFWEYTSCIFMFDDLIYVLSSITHLHFAV